MLLLQLDPPGKGLPDGDYYIIFYATVSDGASYNVTPLSSPTQYTASERIITPGSQNTYSNNLVVLYDSFQRSISCELIYLPLQFKYSECHIRRGINSSLARALPTTSIHIQLLNREGDVVIGTNNDEILLLTLKKNLRSPLKLNSSYEFSFHVINCSNLVKTCSIANICSYSSLLNSSIINHEKIICKTKRKLQTSNTPNNNLVTIVNTPSSLKERDKSDLHDGICIPDKIKSLSFPFLQLPMLYLFYQRSSARRIITNL